MRHRPHAAAFAALLLSLSATTTVLWSQNALSHLTVLESTEMTMTLAALLPTTRPDGENENDNYDHGVQVRDSVRRSSTGNKRVWNQPDLTFTLPKMTSTSASVDNDDSMEHEGIPNRKVTTTSMETKKPTSVRRDRDTRGRSEDLPLCTREQVGRGEWVLVRLDHAPYVTPTVHLRCYPREHYYGPFYDTWAWQPYAAAAVQVSAESMSTGSTQRRLLGARAQVTNEQDDDEGDADQQADDYGDDHGVDGEADYEDGENADGENEEDNVSCEFTDWQPDLFCRLLPKATIAIVGDSLSWEHYSSLVQLLGLRTRQGYQHQSRELHTNIQQSVCDGETAVVYRRDDKLLELPSVWQQPEEYEQEEDEQHETTATAGRHSSFPTVLILNRGAHYVNDTMLLAGVRRNIIEVGEWMHECRALGVDCHFFWRTSVPGHVGCDNNSTENNDFDYSRPINDLEAMESRIANRSLHTEYQLRYHWYNYQHQNELILSELEGSGLDYTVLDAYRLNVLRPDEHRSHQNDCLHNCYPGKMDVYNQLLLHFLRQRISAKSVRQTKAVARKQGWKTDVTTVYDKKATEAAKEKRLLKKIKV
jgi:hypothetical protein